MEMRPVNRAILRHVALYRLTLPIVVERLFCQKYGGDASTILIKLAKEGYLRDHKTLQEGAFKGKVRYFTLTREGAKVAGVSEERGEVLGPAALPKHLATLWFCCMSDQRRHRLEPNEIEALFGSHALHPNTPCCVAEEQDGLRVYRIYETSTDVARTVKQLRASIAKAWESSFLRPWLESGELGFVILAKTRSKCADLNKAMKSDGQLQPSVADECHVIVRFAPGPANLKATLGTLEEERP